MSAPVDLLLPYQHTWVDDKTRLKIGVWARQTGKSFSTAAESVLDCRSRKTDWVTLSTGERQALEWMRKAREWANACRIAFSDYQELRDSPEGLLKSAEMKWPNGSRLIAIPANPATARGYSANLTLDEFAFHENPDLIWRAIYPSISNPLKGTFKLRIVSTPNGQGNKFHELWSKDNGYAKHRITIHDAVERGLPLDIDELRAGLDDAEGWAQEYECEFIDTSSVLLPYDLIASCEARELSANVDASFWATRAQGMFLGIDFGRKRDLTVCWALQKMADTGFTREVLELANMSTPEQFEILSPRVRAAARVCMDYTGSGTGLGDYLVKEFGEYNPGKHKFGKIEICTFTAPFKREIFPKLRMAFESGRVRIPESRVIREDLHAVHRIASPGGEITYRAPHSPDGHADRCTALALAVRAMGAETAPKFGFDAAVRVNRRNII